jgi:hypothetical protein
VAGLDASVTVTVGAGGAGGASGANAGSQGGASSFGTAVSANGGLGGNGSFAFSGISAIAGGASQTTATGDLTIPGSGANLSHGITTTLPLSGSSGSGFLGAVQPSQASFNELSAVVGRLGSGSRGPVNGVSRTAKAGNVGGDGIVIIELYA